MNNIGNEMCYQVTTWGHGAFKNSASHKEHVNELSSKQESILGAGGSIRLKWILKGIVRWVGWVHLTQDN